MAKEWLDDDGYPTDEMLDEVEQWPIKSDADCRNLLETIWPNWRYGDCGYWHVYAGVDDLGRPIQVHQMSTAGWSGNESIIGAMRRNTMFYMMTWESHCKGGHYEFRVTPPTPGPR